MLNIYFQVATKSKQAIISKVGPSNTIVKSSTSHIEVIKVLIPDNLNIKVMLADNPIHVEKCKNNIQDQSDKIAYLLHNLISASNRNKDLDQEYQNLYSPILQSSVHDYKVYLNYLIAQGVILCDDDYMVGEKSYGYKLTSKYANAPLRVEVIQCKSKQSNYRLKLRNNPINKQASRKYPLLYNTILSLNIKEGIDIKDFVYKNNINLANDYADEKLQNKSESRTRDQIINTVLNSWYTSLFNIQQGYHYFKQDNTSNRLHTSYLSIKKELRNIIEVNGKSISSCDIKNSQPYISSIFFNNKKFGSKIKRLLDSNLQTLRTRDPKLHNELMSKIDSVKNGMRATSTENYLYQVKNGTLYEYLAINYKMVYNEDFTRDFGKKMMFDILFSPAKSSKKRDLFRILFPEVSFIFESINSTFTMTKLEADKRSDPHQTNVLAVILQTIESGLILNQVCKNIHNKDSEIHLLTLHDAVATTEENVSIVQEEMTKCFIKVIGVKPTIEIE